MYRPKIAIDSTKARVVSSAAISKRRTELELSNTTEVVNNRLNDQIHKTMSSSAICAKRGCTLAAYVEPRTKIVHKYCGRTHALEALGQNSVPAPHGMCHRCNLSGCTKTVAFDTNTGRVHDFCCKDHADRAIRSGEWQKPLRDTYLYDGAKKQAAGQTCQFPNCTLPVFIDPTGRELDYCGRSHAVAHRLLQGRVRHTNNSSSSVAAVAGGGTSFHTGLAIASNASNPSGSTVKASNTSHSFTKIHTTGYAKAVPVVGNSTTSFTKVHSTGYAQVVPLAEDSKPSAASTATATSTRMIRSLPAAASTPTISRPQCAICLAMNASIILIPCGHVCLCKVDADKFVTNQQLVKCPICRQAILSTKRSF
jgi:hypothetical protein